MMSAAEPMSKIPAHRSTIERLLRLKPANKNWDEFLLSTFEDWLPPKTVREIGRGGRRGKSRTFAEVEWRHPNLGTQRT
jgi:hypothetical protein